MRSEYKFEVYDYFIKKYVQRNYSIIKFWFSITNHGTRQFSL